MLLKLFKSNHPLVIVLIPILGLILWIPSLFNLNNNIQNVDLGVTTMLFDWVINLFNFHPKASAIFALILLIIQSYIIIRLNFKYIFIENKTYLPSIFFVVFTSALLAYQKLHPLLFANIFFLLALDKALLFEKSKNHFKRYFESGIFLGLGSVFYPNIYIFIVIIWLTMIYLRTFNVREWLSSILGTITPFAIYLGVMFLADKTDGMVDKFIEVFTSSAESLKWSNYSLIALGFLAFIFFISIITGARVVGVKKISTRKYYSLFLLMILYSIGAYLLIPALGFELLIIIAIPLSIICSIYFTDIRSKWLSEVIFTLTLLSVLVIIWF